MPDARLRLMFVCAHPALAPQVHAPLMLQAVLGLQAQTIAHAFLASPAAMAQRLVRAKAKIKAAGLRFEEPEARDLPARQAAVLGLLVKGLSNKAIARELGIAEGTVKVHVAALYRALQVRNRASAVASLTANGMDRLRYA